MNPVITLEITVYTKPESVQVGATLSSLRKHGFSAKEIDVSSDPEARDYVMALGYLQAPVVTVRWMAGDVSLSKMDSWSGFRPKRIEALQTKCEYVASSINALLDEGVQNSLRKLVAV